MYQFEFSGNYVIMRCNGIVVSVKERQDYSSDESAREEMTTEYEAT